MSQKIQIPKAVVEIIQELEKHKHTAYLVGGYVRDQILSSEDIPHITEDFDLATSATPEEIKLIFPDDKIFAYGERHGTVTLRRDGINYELTTFREEEGYSDGRRPDKVTFIRDLTTDLARRDFTINSFALEKDGSIIDYFNGLNDLENKIVRAVGDPVKRLQEDSLRIFRAIRFAVKLGFNIEEDTKKAIIENRHLILEHQLSGERIFVELNGIMKNLPRGVMMLHDLGLLEILFRDYNTHEHIDWLFGLLEDRKYQDNQPTSDLINWGILLHYILEDIPSNKLPSKVKDIFTKYPGMGNDKIGYILQLIQFVRSFYNIVNLDSEVVYSVTYEINEILNPNTNSKQFFTDVIKLLKILDDRWGNTNIENLEKIVKGFIPKLEHTMPLDGKDLMSIGYNGKSVGLLLKYLKLIHHQDLQKDKFHLLDYINNFDFKRSIFILKDYLAKYNLNPEEELENFVMESLIVKMRTEYQLVASPERTIVVEVDKKFISFIDPFLKGLGRKAILINSQEELPENVIAEFDTLKIKHIRFKYHNIESIETLLELSLTDQNTIIFNVK
ncbi:MAG: hypothetical protein GPJ54_07935 [Candidatus Heimdallarchaeota archaeon]|nr:hypothetical protein [Candidatus Heimdallarchaeota archaeon]